MINVRSQWFLDIIMLFKKQSVAVYCPYPKPGSERERAVDGLISFCGTSATTLIGLAGHLLHSYQ